MKKFALLLLCGGLLVACSSSSYSVSVSGSGDVLVSGDELSLTKQEYFEYLLDQYGSEEIVKETLSAIADKEMTDQDALTALVKEKKETYASYAENDLATYAKKLGYDSEQTFIDEYVTSSAKQELLRKQYLKEHLDDFIKSYQVVSMKKIIFEKESEALAAIKESTSAEIFDKKLSDAGSKGEDSGVVTKNSTLDDNLKSKLETLSAITKDGVYSEAIKLSDNTYAVVYLYNTDHKDNDKIISSLSSDADVQEEIEGIYLKKYNFEVKDSKIKNAIKKLSDQYIE